MVWPSVTKLRPSSEFTDWCLSERTMEMLLYDQHVRGGVLSRRRTLPLGQTLKRMRPTEDRLACIYPNAGYWECLEQRPIFGAELLRAQGLDEAMAPAIRDFSNHSLIDLAGNAFSAAAAIPYTLASIVALPLPLERASGIGPCTSPLMLEGASIVLGSQFATKVAMRP